MALAQIIKKEGKKMKEIYLKLTEDEIEDVLCALHSWNESYSSNCMNYDSSETDALIGKIFGQKDSTVCRPYVVSGVHNIDMLCLPTKMVVMAEEPQWAIEYAKEYVEKNQGGQFVIKEDDVHELADDEFLEVRE
jgi:hypothetical protein